MSVKSGYPMIKSDYPKKNIFTFDALFNFPFKI